MFYFYFFPSCCEGIRNNNVGQKTLVHCVVHAHICIYRCFILIKLCDFWYFIVCKALWLGRVPGVGPWPQWLSIFTCFPLLESWQTGFLGKSCFCCYIFIYILFLSINCYFYALYSGKNSCDIHCIQTA